jgi:uncharacterized protein (TIGR03435 family)
MLQNLLAERFKLTLHREKKDFPIMALMVGKNGPKLKESAPAPPADDGAPPAPLPPPGKLPMDKNGFPKLPPGAGRGGMMIMMNGGRFHMMANGATMAQLADMLSNQLGRPVVDETRLTAKYDIELDFAPEPGMGPRGPMGPMPMPPGGGPDGVAPAPPPSEGGPNLVTAIQEQLGLKLDSRKGPLDVLLIDHAERVPTEN